MDTAKGFGQKGLIVLLSFLFFSGCNFFGKKKDEGDSRRAGELSGGTNIVGTYGVSTSSVSDIRNPTYAITETYIFDPNLTARIEIRDAHLNGAYCTAYGQYRIVGEREVFIYIQSVNPPICAFQPVMHLANVHVKSQYLQYEDPDSRHVFHLLVKRGVAQAVVGLWDFNGQGGIDYVFFDANGYFLLQFTDQGEKYLTMGHYAITDGKLTLNFMSNMDPANVVGAPFVFQTFATDGNTLQLGDEGSSGMIYYTGTRL